jgi:serine/threonine-protein kinase HipA
MSINSKTDDFTREDFRAVAQAGGLKRGKSAAILAEVMDVVRQWPRYARAAGVSSAQRDKIARTLRLEFDHHGVLRP